MRFSLLQTFIPVTGIFCLALSAAQYPLDFDLDRLGGAPDFSFLNAPLTDADRIVVRDGRFHRVGDGARVRFFGVNLAFGANFPAEADAPRIARRLRKLGVNLVRLHHMDTQPDANPANAGSILTSGPYPTLNPVAVARLRAFLDALKAEGIYINLNLHVGYQFRPAADGVPGPAIPSQSKPLHILHPRMIDLQCDFTRAVLGALRLAGDPVLAQIEINNESSLVDSWQRTSLDVVTGEYRDELARQWNRHLAARYPGTEALRAAWGPSEPDGAEMLPRTGWRLEIHAPSRASMQAGEEVVTVNVEQGGNWVYAKQTGFSLTTTQPYVAQIAIRADLPTGVTRSVYWDVKQDVSPWRTATSRTITVTAAWQTYTMAFQPAFSMEGIGRFALSVENVGAPVHLRDWSLKPAGRRGLAEDETIEAGNVALVSPGEIGTATRGDDFVLFLADRDRYYLERIRDAARETVGEVPIAGTQMGYGGLLNLDSHAGLDYDDNHFYVDHYGFPNVAWDGRDWYIREQSSIGGGLSAFENMAAARRLGRPYTISEFNQPWPNTYAAEIDPTLAAFAALQDWDGILHFAYAHNRNWDDGVPNGFNLTGDWTKLPGIGQSAWLFRSGAIQPGRTLIELPAAPETRLRATREKRNGSIAAFLESTAGYDPATAFVHRVALSDTGAALPRFGSPYRSDTGELTYDRANRLYLIHASQAAGVFGFAAAGKASAGPLEVELAPEARGFAAILLTALDNRPLGESQRMLLTAPGYTLRTQPGTTRPQALINYPNTRDRWTLEPDNPGKPSGNLNGGLRPVWMERIEGAVTLRLGLRFTVYPLDGAGNRREPIPVADQTFQLTDTPWYEITAEPLN